MDPHAGLNLPEAASWSVFLGSLGKYLIIAGALSFAIALLSSILAGRKPVLTRVGTLSFLGGAFCVFGAMAVLVTLFVKDQFCYEYVFRHSDILAETRYKVASVWSGQEGSFLLWATTSALFGVLALWTTRNYRRWFVAPYSLFLGSICGILAYETPFKLTLIEGKPLMPPTGMGLVPSLQNYWVVIHPPTIFLGFGSLAVLFCFAVSAILTRNLTDWVKLVRPWALISTALLGLGLCMGGFWAYETLGWGGFWMWDPVENVSFVPWIFAAAFLHGIIVQVNRGRWTGANLLMAALPFLTFVYGTFLTRSGFLTESSVHSFAEMDHKALYILLGFMVLNTVLFLSLWFAKGLPLGKAMDRSPQPTPIVAREPSYKLGVILLSMLSGATAIGMSIPFFMSLAHRPSKVVEEPMYHQVLGWFFIPIMILMAVAPFIGWRGIGKAGERLLSVLAVSVFCLGLTILFLRMPDWGLSGISGESATVTIIPFTKVAVHIPLTGWVMGLYFLCVFSAVANVWRVWEMLRSSPVSVGGFVSHLGVAVLMAGLIVSRGAEQKKDALFTREQPGSVLGYQVSYDKETADSVFDRKNSVLLRMDKFDHQGKLNADESFTAEPGLYYIQQQDGAINPQIRPYIHHELFHDVYVTLNPPIMDAWEQPQTFKPNQTQTINGIKATYLGMRREGQPGQMGTKFYADFKLETQQGSFKSSPAMEITENGPQMLIADAGPDLLMSLQGMDVGAKSVTVQAHLAHPVYRVEVFYKPLTIFVWAGAGILAFGGLLSAFYRRPPRIRASDESETPTSVEESEKVEEDALIPVA